MNWLSFLVFMLLGSWVIAGFVGTLPINATQILNQHNIHRSPSTPLEWDVNLQNLAQEYSNECVYNYTNPIELAEGYAQIQGVVYSGTQEESVGENMAVALSNVDISPWVNQSANWLCIPDTCIPGTDCNQWKKIISSTTTNVGCGRSLCSNSTNFNVSSTWELLVCHYNPYDVQQRTLPVSQCPLNCSWSDWSKWSPCCEDNGPGLVRSRVQKPGQPSGAPCTGDSQQFENCNCSANYTYSKPVPVPVPVPVPLPVPLVVTAPLISNPGPAQTNRGNPIIFKLIFLVINLISFNLYVKRNGTITPAGYLKTTLQSIVSEWLQIVPVQVGIALVSSSSGYLVTVSVTSDGSQPVPEANALADILRTQSAQNNITQLTQMNFDPNSITIISSPNPQSPDNPIFGIGIAGLVSLTVGCVLALIAFVLVVVVVVKFNDRKNRPWQEFV